MAAVILLVAKRLEETPQESSSKFANTGQSAQLLLPIVALVTELVTLLVSSGNGQSYNQV